jgi:cytochrome c oxidase assembly factor CtaG
MLVASPLLVLGRPFTAFLWALPPRARAAIGSAVRSRPWRAAWGFATGAFTVWLLHAAALWIWHVPFLYEAALRNDGIHRLQHVCFVVTACLFWWALVHGRYGRVGYGVGVLYVFLTAIHTGALGALLTFSSRVLYPLYAARGRTLGVDPLEDQRLAGLIMWIPFGIVFLVIGLALFAAWLGESERRARAAESATRSKAAAASVLVLVLFLSSCRKDATAEAERWTGGRKARGAAQIQRYGCGACHEIPGIPGAHASVGPPLSGIAGRAYLAGRLPNEPSNLVSWIRDPQHIQPPNAMPDMGVSEPDARDIAAYLYTLR